jgi:hypothetical protein
VNKVKKIALSSLINSHRQDDYNRVASANATFDQPRQFSKPPMSR